MKDIIVATSEVVIWEHKDSTPELEDIARRGDLIKIPHAYGYVILEESISDIQKLFPRAKYILEDGHNRHQAAVRAKVDLPFIVLECPADYLYVKNQTSYAIERAKWSYWHFNNWIQTQRIDRILRPDLYQGWV